MKEHTMLPFGQEQITRLKRVQIRTEGSVRTEVVVSWLHFLLYACPGWLIHCLLFPLDPASRRPHKTLNASLSVGSWAKPKLQGGRLVWGMDNFSSIAFSLLKLPCGMPFWVARKWFCTCIIKRPRFVWGREKVRNEFRDWHYYFIQIGSIWGFPESLPCKGSAMQLFVGCWLRKMIQVVLSRLQSIWFCTPSWIQRTKLVL